MKLVQQDGESEFWVMDVPFGVLTNCTVIDVASMGRLVGNSRGDDAIGRRTLVIEL